MNGLLIHYDCDPGQDDAIAYFYALGAGVDISGISVVGGNVDVHKCARNALQLLELTDRTHIPLYVGADRPLKRLSQPLPDVFGECGMAGANLPAPRKEPERQEAWRYLAAAHLPETMVLTGPQTNLALALKENPHIPSTVKRLVMMGGCVYPEKIHGRLGNIQVKGSDEWAEYNFAVDPEAAQIVFSAGFEEICVIPLEVTRSVLYNHDIDRDLRALGQTISGITAGILSTVGSEDKIDYASEMAFADDPVRAMHDVVAMAYLVNPELFTTETLPLRIVTQDPPAGAGQTVIDHDAPDHPAVTVITDLDRDQFRAYLLSYIGKLK